MILILASGGQTARTFARWLGYQPRDWRYVASLDTLLGIERGTTVLLVGDYWRREQWHEFRYEMHVRGLTTLIIDDARLVQ
jgi:hypothetical protein